MPRARVLAWVLLLAAVAASAIGFFWAAVTGLPYQDPTPDMLSRQAAELRRAEALFAGGLLAAIAVAVWLWRTRARRA